MRYRIVHQTTYLYEGRVDYCHNLARLTPRELPNQTVEACHFKINPLPINLRHHVDFFGNHTSYFSIQEPHRELTITVESIVNINQNYEAGDIENSLPWDHIEQDLSGSVPEIRQFTLESPKIAISAELADYGRVSFPPHFPLLKGARNLTQRIFEDFEFVSGFTTIATPLSEVMQHRRGVCQDFAQIALGCLRSLGIAARYVSGYIQTVAPPGQKRLIGADASHAWISVYDRQYGWIDFDPTNNQIPTDKHITLAWGRDYSDISPLKGVMIGSGDHELTCAVDVISLE